ncbi:energy transducer TonB family protein [Silvibacterium sp.]|uniref:energy transducer TonB family protein n=1 Tax=Silvibacterium sp. TaxID=1964179 RepID=UPI0039E3BA75
MPRASMLRSLLYFAGLLLVLPFGITRAAHAQVMPTRNWQRALAQARSMLPGTSNDGVPYHLHYDLHFRGPHDSDRIGTYDIYVDPHRFRRTDIDSGDFHETFVENVQDNSASWRSITGEMPLGIYDFESILRDPSPAIFAIDHSESPKPPVVRQQILEGSPYDCADDGEMARVCFDPFTRVFAIAQILNQSFVYSDWIPMNGAQRNRRAIPSLIRIYDGKTLLLTANGKVEKFQQFAPLFFVRTSPQQKDPVELRPVVRFGDFKAVPWYGNAAVRITVNAEGKVEHADVVDIDNHKIEHAAVKFIRDLRFRPASEVPDAPATFTTLFYLRYLPRAGMSLP